MSRLMLLADMHLGHKAICKYRTQFSTAQEHDDFVLSNYKEAADRLDELPGYKILVLGNHDTDRSRTEAAYLLTKFDRVYSLATKKQCWLSHAPIHPAELRGKFNIHGHVHNKTLQDPCYANVCMENINYFPVDFQEVKASLIAGEIFTKAV